MDKKQNEAGIESKISPLQNVATSQLTNECKENCAFWNAQRDLDRESFELHPPETCAICIHLVVVDVLSRTK